ncbi:hypothetical protein [Lysobacter sp. A3-1-A15]|uniref:hypothetical protein n=1 Tax=Novilysobacter viscosus TaxID=3098602 RepID=UPI002EDADD7D
MRYSEEALAQIAELFEPRAAALEQHQLQALLESGKTTSAEAMEHLTHGAGRRFGLLHHALHRVFQLFPPDATEPLPRETLSDVQVNLHAFFINLVGLFDNFAWAFASHHNLTDVLAKPLSIDLFKSHFQTNLPPKLASFLQDPTLAGWHKNYLKNYRDALAHRIPLYVPPCNIYTPDREQYERLEEMRLQLQKEWRFDEAEAVRAEQARLEHPCFTFVHSFKPGASAGHMFVHAQLLADAGTVSSVSGAFYESWLARA